MQTLNVNAGQSEQEYKAAEERRRADLRAESTQDANFFFWAAVLAALGSGLLPLRLNILVNIGVIDLLRLYAAPFGPLQTLAVLMTAILWVSALIGLGFAGRGGYRWAFLVGMVLYAVDMLALVVTFSLWAFGVHAFFVFKWFEAQKRLRDLRESALACA
jgi:hypothetical protein